MAVLLVLVLVLASGEDGSWRGLNEKALVGVGVVAPLLRHEGMSGAVA